MKNTSSLILICLFIISCGGGGGSSAGLSGSSGGGPNYTYSKVQARYDNNTVGQYDSSGVVVAQTYNSETGSLWRNYFDLDSRNLSFLKGTDANSNEFIQISISKYNDDFTPDGTSTPNVFNLNYSYSFTGNDIVQIYNAPNYVYATEFFSNAYLISYGLNDTTAFAGTEYVDMVMWWMDYDDGRNDYVAFAFGDSTFSGDMPTSSSATFDVKSMGFWISNGQVYVFNGDGSLIADFQNMTLTGNILNDYVTDRQFTWSQLVGATAGGIEFNGTISGSSASGTIDWGNGFGTGEFTADFFGPDASEIGGSYAAFADENGYDNFISGTFIGER